MGLSCVRFGRLASWACARSAFDLKLAGLSTAPHWRIHAHLRIDAHSVIARRFAGVVTQGTQTVSDRCYKCESTARNLE